MRCPADLAEDGNKRRAIGPENVGVVRREKFIRETFIGETNQQLLAPGSFNSVQKPLASGNIAELFSFFKRINTGSKCSEAPG